MSKDGTITERQWFQNSWAWPCVTLHDFTVLLSHVKNYRILDPLHRCFKCAFFALITTTLEYGGIVFALIESWNDLHIKKIQHVPYIVLNWTPTGNRAVNRLKRLVETNVWKGEKIIRFILPYYVRSNKKYFPSNSDMAWEKQTLKTTTANTSLVACFRLNKLWK